MIAKFTNGNVTLAAHIQRSGTHRFSVRVDNLDIKNPSKEVHLKSGNEMTLEWHCKIRVPDEPWVAVIIPENNLSGKKELRGAAWEKN